MKTLSISKFILNTLIISMSSVIYAKDINVIKKQSPKNQPKRMIELDYFTKTPLIIDRNITQYPVSGVDLNEFNEEKKNNYKYNPVVSKETLELNKKTAMREQKALARAGEYLALVCTSKTNCTIQSNQVFTRKERVWAGYDVEGSYPYNTEDGVVAWVDKPIQGTVLFIQSNLPAIKKGHAIKTWYANLEALKAREKNFNPNDYIENQTDVQKVLTKNKYKKTIFLDNKKQFITIYEIKEKNDSIYINWGIKLNNVEKKLTSMREPMVGIDHIADVSDYLLWVGDLDGDNQPDLIINNDVGWGELEYKLFLSTDIKPNKPWKPAATFDRFSGEPHC